MKSKSPRIYTYKITFEEVPYYYYGVHKENRYDEYYMGSAITHKWMWDFYTPRKQILQFFDFTDEGWIEANEVEKRIIRPFYQTDQWCLNENCGGKFSLDVNRKNGKLVKAQKLGIHGLTSEKIKQNASKGGNRSNELGVGAHGLSAEEKRKRSEKSALTISEKYSKQFVIISPEGKIYEGKNIRKFCRTNKLDPSHIRKVLKGDRSHHKGWRKYIPDKITILNFL